MPSVLVAETHAPTLDLLREALSQAGYRISVASEPALALELCAIERPDAVVVAVDFPRWQGQSLGKLLRAAEGGARLPILAVDKAHLGREKGVGAILDLMVNAYLPGASPREELLSRLAQLLANADRSPRPAQGLAATLARPPVATGTLRSRSLPALLHSLRRLARDGALVVVHRDLTRRVFFLKGAPVAYDSSAPQDSLGRHLMARGLLTSEQHDAMLELQRDAGASPGSALVGAGVVQPGEPLLALLREYAREKIAQAYAMPEGRYSFHAGAEFASEVPRLELPALAPIYESARARWPARAFAEALAPHMQRYPARTSVFSKDLQELGLSTADLKIALALDGRQTLRELLHATRDLKHALALFWFLTLTGALEHLAASAQRAPGALELRERPALKRKPLPEEQARQLREEAVRVLTGSYFGALGLDISADAEAVERAFHEAATRFHSDSYTEFELGPLAELLASVQDKIGAAYRILSDGEKRKAYVGYVLARAEVPRTAPPQVEAEVALKRGEKLMRKGDWRGARLAFEQAVGLQPREPEYYGYLAWATFEASDGERAQRARVALKLVKKALAMNPTLERLQVIAAILEHESGDPAEARRLLLKLLKANPEMRLAQRALQGLNRRASG